MTQTKEIKVLDCTLRDGGYYSNWFFDKDVVSSYLETMSTSNIDYVEVGFRMPTTSSFGPFARSEESFLEKLQLPDGPIYGVMINAEDYIEDSKNKIKKYFSRADESLISFVRIAVIFDDAEKTQDIAGSLKKLGYKVAINLMQSHDKKKAEYKNISTKISAWDCVDVLYYADSLGNMNSPEITKAYQALRSGWKGDLGIHTHNNKGLALNNTIQALNSGVKFCDSTILGMGRGAGNAQTENLLLELGGKYKTKHMIKLLNKFEKLKKKYQWGFNYYYHFAAMNNIHPTYVQRLLSEHRYSPEYILKTLELLKNIKSSSFNESSMTELTYFTSTSNQGSWNAKNFLENKDVLLIGAGPLVESHKEEIDTFIKTKNPYVISLNINKNIDKKKIDAIVASNIKRVLLDAEMYSSFSCPIIMPRSCFSRFIDKKLTTNLIHDYGLAIKPKTFKSLQKGCVSQWEVVTAYCLLFLIQAAPQKIYLAGFDGYKNDAQNHNLLNKIFKAYFSNSKSIPLIPITPTKHKILEHNEFQG